MNDNQITDNGPLIVHFHPGELVDLAAVSFVAAHMNSKIMQFRENREKGFNIFAVHSIYELFNLPMDLDEKVENFMNLMITAISQWWDYHYECIFLRRLSPDSMIDWLDQLVWLSDGTINYGQTAKKLLKGDKLTNVQKFELACGYCFVNDVEFLKGALTNEEINAAFDEFHEFDDAVLNYWSWKLSGGSYLNWIWTNVEFVFFVKIMADLKRHYNEWHPIEYFFNRLNDQERLLKANDIIDLEKPRLTWHLLPALTGSELNSIIRGKSRTIMKALLKEHSYFEYAVSLWKRIVYLIDDATICDILFDIHDLEYERNCVNSLLWEIWLVLSDHQKKSMVDLKFCDFPQYCVNEEENLFYKPNFPLILDILTRSDLKSRSEYWLKLWPCLVVGQLDHLSSINRIMKLCIGNDKQIDDFKNTVMLDHLYIMAPCGLLISYARIKEIQMYLEFCTSDPQVIRDVKKKIMTTARKQDVYFYLFHFSQESSRTVFYEYLADIFTEHESKEFLNEIVLHPANLNQMCIMLNGRLDKIIEFVEKFVSSEQSLAKVKNYFLEKCRRENNIERFVFLDLIAWSFNVDKQMLDMFKKFPPLDSEVKAMETEQETENPIFDAFMEHYLRFGIDE